MMDPYGPKSKINMSDLAAALSDLPEGRHLVKVIHSRYSYVAVQAGRTPAPIHTLDRLLGQMGCSSSRGKGRWINVDRLSKGWQREDWTPRGLHVPVEESPAPKVWASDDDWATADEFH